MVICEESVDKREVELFNKILATVLENIGQRYEKLTANVMFVSEEEIRSLNAKYRDVDNVTDVLSFPFFDEFDIEINPKNCPFDVDPTNGEISLGDVFICRDVAIRQAIEYGHSTERELGFLFLHSVLHLLGYDHIDEAEAKFMRAKESEILEILNIGRDYEF